MSYISRRFSRIVTSGWDPENVVFLDISGADELAQFRATRSLTVPLSIDEIDPEHCGARAWAVLVTLDGATARQPFFSIAVTHHGACRQRWWIDHLKTVVDQPDLAASRQNAFVFPPSSETSQVVATLIRAGGENANRKLPTGFWGRGIAATWSIRITSFEYEDKGVDLTNLTGVKLTVLYERCVNEPEGMEA